MRCLPAALAASASQMLTGLIRRLPQHGTTVMLVSHRLVNLIETTNRIYVLRRGTVVCELKTSGTSEHALLSAMAGLEEVAAGTAGAPARPPANPSP
jgi:ABC-type sugar transport system ATPase subunit